MPHTTIYVAPRRRGTLDPDAPAVATDDLARLFARRAALAGVSIEVRPGAAIAVVGPNGAGKTTLLRILATAIRPSFGAARVDGLDVTRRPDEVRGRVAYLGHTGGLYDDLTAAENLAFAARLLAVDAPEVDDRVAAALATVGLDEAGGQRVASFSAGMRKRVALGRLLLSPLSLVLLDEPFAALDVEGMDLVEQLMRAWREVGITVLAASHALERLTAHVDGTLELEGGLVSAVAGEGIRLLPGGAVGATRPATAVLDR